VYIRKNMEAIEQVLQAQCAGESLAMMKPLYIKQNTFDIGLDDPIYRIFQLEYLEADISGKILTQVRARPDSWCDDLENPLLKAAYTDSVTGRTFNLKGIVEDFYALSWTKSANETRDAWSEFSHGRPAVRVETTPRLLLNRLMQVEDEWFMLRHFVGLVKYEHKAEIEAFISGCDYSVHLDSLGQNLAQSLMLLRSDLKSEAEVRLLFTLIRNSPNTWFTENVKHSDETCKIPFEWCGAIKSVLFGPQMTHDLEGSFNRLLAQEGIQCTTSKSCLWPLRHK
jgi:hypothetical protein